MKESRVKRASDPLRPRIMRRFSQGKRRRVERGTYGPGIQPRKWISPGRRRCRSERKATPGAVGLSFIFRNLRLSILDTTNTLSPAAHFPQSFTNERDCGGKTVGDVFDQEVVSETCKLKCMTIQQITAITCTGLETNRKTRNCVRRSKTVSRFPMLRCRPLF